LEEQEEKLKKEYEKAERKKAWAHWVAQKKEEDLRRQYIEIQRQKMMQKMEHQKNKLSRQKFLEWCNKKELERLSK